jgi:hypothetical protein
MKAHRASALFGLTPLSSAGSLTRTLGPAKPDVSGPARLAPGARLECAAKRGAAQGTVAGDLTRSHSCWFPLQRPAESHCLGRGTGVFAAARSAARETPQRRHHVGGTSHQRRPEGRETAQVLLCPLGAAASAAQPVAQSTRQRQATSAQPEVSGTFSPAQTRRPAVVDRLART